MTNACRRKWKEKKREVDESRRNAKMPPLPPHATHRRIRQTLLKTDSVTASAVQTAKEMYNDYRQGINSVCGDLNWGLSAVCPLDRNRRPVLIMNSKRRMSPEQVKSVLKWTPSRGDLNALHKCTPDMLGLKGLSFEVRLDHVDGPILAIKLVDAFTFEESQESLQLLECHRCVSLGWNKGCEADPLPSSQFILSQLKNQNAMKSAGFASTNVKEILHIGPRTESCKGASKFSYKNSKGQVIHRPMSSLIDRHKWNATGSKSLSSTFKDVCNKESSMMIDKVKRAFQDNLTLYMESRSFPHTEIVKCMKVLESTIGLTTLAVSINHPIAIHRDPHTPVFAAIFGHTTYKFSAEGRWKDANKGGSLFLADGLLDLSYSPRDLILMDGNIAHGVTTVGHNIDGACGERFSAIMFSGYNRIRVMAPGNYDGMYDCKK